MNPFKNISSDSVIQEHKYFVLIKDKFPVSPGHLLIISKRETNDYFSLNTNEKIELIEAIDSAKKMIESEFKPDGYNIGMNCGIAAGQTVIHFHCHIMPRYLGDMRDPNGGVRHCVAGKGYY